MRAAIYARYSSELQNATSIEDQTHQCRKLIAGRDWVEGQVYSDMAISGTSKHRPDYQRMLEDAKAGKFEVLVAEGLDRLSRDQADIATLYKELVFREIPIVTVAEGEISEMHIGLKGTMAALYLKDLGQKTRRGQEGRVRAGKSGGGNSYGYRVVRQVTANGDVTTGERETVPEEAAVVRRIFRDYAAGKSPRAIAAALNAEGVPGPRGKAWGTSTIHGNADRGTGILNNALYVGRLVWNRQRYVKDPSTGKRQARANPPEDWVTRDVIELRIVDQDLWDAVKARQGRTRYTVRGAERRNGFGAARRPTYLFSGLLKCGCCGASYTLVNKVKYGCAAVRNKGTCTNRALIRRSEVEARVLDGLKEHLMHPDLVAEFMEEYRREHDRLMQTARNDRTRLEKELGQVRRQIEQIVDAIADGFRNETMKTKLTDLEARKAELEAELAEMGDEQPIRLHPGLADHYRAKVADLAAALDTPETRREAADAMRGLLTEIRMHPEGDGHTIELVGDLAGILARSEGETKAPPAFGARVSHSLVAGVGFEPTTFRL